MLFGISGTELMVILVITLVLVGPDKLPDYARKVGRFIHSMRVRGQAVERTKQHRRSRPCTGFRHQ